MYPHLLEVVSVHLSQFLYSSECYCSEPAALEDEIAFEWNFAAAACAADYVPCLDEQLAVADWVAVVPVYSIFDVGSSASRLDLALYGAVDEVDSSFSVVQLDPFVEQSWDLVLFVVA